MTAHAGASPPAVPSLARNSGWNLAAFACALAANFITVPFVVRWAGLDAFGRAGIVLAVCAPMMMVGTVLGQAVTREVAGAAGQPTDEHGRRVLDAALRIALVACIAGWCLLVLAGPGIVGWLMHTDGPGTALTLAFVIAATGWAAQQIALVFQGARAARQDFRSIARMAAFSAVAHVAGVLGATWVWPTVEGYLAGVTVGFVASMLGWLRLSSQPNRGLAAWKGERRAETAALLHFGKWQGVAQLAGTFGNQVDRYALASLAPAAAVGNYNVANRLQEAAYIGIVKVAEVLFPRFGSLSAAQPSERRDFFQVASWVVGVFSAAALAPLVPLSSATLQLWVGPEAASGASVMLKTLVLGGIVGAGTNVFIYCAMGMGRTSTVAALSVTYSILTIAGTIVLLRQLGPAAAGAGLLLASIVRLALAMRMTRRDFFPDLGRIDLVASTALPVACGVAVAMLADTAQWFQPSAWWMLAVDYALLSLLVLATTVALTAAVGRGSIPARAWRSLRLAVHR